VRLGIDIDGVMYKWDKTARYMLRDVLPGSPYREVLQQESSSWDWIKEQVSPEHWRWLWTEGVRLGLFRYGHLYPGTIQAMRLLVKQGHEVVLITHRPQSAVPDTFAWLSWLNLPLAGLHLLTNAEPKSLVHPQCDVYLDDKPDNIEDLHLRTGARAVCLMRRPWNTMYTPDAPFTHIVKTWGEFHSVVENAR
jgi:hypothetical protein